MSDKIKVIFDAAVKANKEKNQVILDLVTAGGLQVTDAVRIYQKLAKESGMILNAKERTSKVNELLKGKNLESAEVRKEFTQQIQDKFDVSSATAAAHIRTYCASNNIALPEHARHSFEDSLKFVDSLHKQKKSRAEIVAALQNDLGYSSNSAASLYSRASRELGIASGRATATVPIEQLVAYIRKHDSKLNKTQLAAYMTRDLGYAESTAKSFLTYVNFAKEWARQELAEKSTK